MSASLLRRLPSYNIIVLILIHCYCREKLTNSKLAKIAEGESQVTLVPFIIVRFSVCQHEVLYEWCLFPVTEVQWIQSVYDVESCSEWVEHAGRVQAEVSHAGCVR